MRIKPVHKPGPIPKPVPGVRLKPADFFEVMRNIPPTCVLIGGQAVGWWAERYRLTDKEISSKDIDFWGKPADLFQVAKALKATAITPSEYEMTFLSGAIALVINDKKTTLEMLHAVPGLDIAQPRSVAMLEKIGKSENKILVLSPVFLALTKLHSLRQFSQEGRQDLFHLQLSLQASRHFISEILDQNAKIALWHCNQIIVAQKKRANQIAEQKHGFQLLSGIPIENIKLRSRDKHLPPSDQERLQNFIQHQWSRVCPSATDTGSQTPIIE